MQNLRVIFFLFSLAIGLLLIIFPELDIAFSSKFFTNKNGFAYANLPIVVLVFDLVVILAKTAWIIWLIIMIRDVLKKRDWRELIRTPACFLFIALVFGPALTVSYAFKEHVGRARPKDIIEFSGTKNFTRAFEISDQCKTNCSFSSGHAAMGYYFTAFAWIAPLQYQNIVFCLTFLFGSVVGFGRILQGGHFLSDTLFSFIVVMIINEISFKLWLFLKNKIKIK